MNCRVVNKLGPKSSFSFRLGRLIYCRPTSRFKIAMCISYRPHVDVHKGDEVWLIWTHVDRGEGESKSDFLWTS